MSDGARPLYERDYVRWTEEQAAALRTAASRRANLPLDWLNLAEEIDSLGRSLKHELRSRLMVIVEHLLELEYSPSRGPRRGWIETVSRERLVVEDLLQESPSLRNELAAGLEAATAKALRLAARGLYDFGEVVEMLPRRYTEEEVLGDWLPGGTPPAAHVERG